MCDNAPIDFVLYNPELLSAFSTILSEREASKREFLNNTKTIFFSLRLAGLPDAAFSFFSIFCGGECDFLLSKTKFPYFKTHMKLIVLGLY